GDDPCDDPPDGEPSAITFHVDSLIVHRQDDGSFSIGGRCCIFHINSSADSLKYIQVQTLFSFVLITVDGAADAKPKKILTDSSLSPVPKAVSSVRRTAKATQTETPPAGPRPTTREKVRQCVIQKI
ncbi:hypothetical protein XENOCAPTIV_021161, partial [Xenoophorus captivus]